MASQWLTVGIGSVCYGYAMQKWTKMKLLGIINVNIDA
jgi:hypothetical protein